MNYIHQLHFQFPKEPFHHDILYPGWYEIIRRVTGKRVKLGLVNMENVHELNVLHGAAELLNVQFKYIAKDVLWDEFFPEWIDEDEVSEIPKCPEVPMPRFEDYRELDVVVAQVPCGGGPGFRDVFRLQVNLVVANMLVRNGLDNHDPDRIMYAIFIGSCGPMPEIFRCDDLLWHDGNSWIYRPDLRRLNQKVMLPPGSCQVARPFAEAGKEVQTRYATSTTKRASNQPREAYVSVVHSSEAYVCGAVMLAQSIIRSKTTKDLVLLVDDTKISPRSLEGLRAAGWKIKKIKRIRSPNSNTESYNEWNYSKLRLWQLDEYDKLMFIDADLIVLKNIDKFFAYPQLSAVGNSRHVFNSGVMLIEPSRCMFGTLLGKRYEVASYNGGDQGFLNEVFSWWHRLPSKINYKKDFISANDDEHRLPDDIYTIHYLGFKPWSCYEDYDCNWDIVDYQRFASDSAHEMWWGVYRKMPVNLRSFCALSPEMNERIKKWRRIAKDSHLSNSHWNIQVKDPRQNTSSKSF